MSDKCVYCGQDVYPNDEQDQKRGGVAHAECSEINDPDDIE